MSEQELVDCSSAQGNNGCNGGFYTNAWDYAIAMGGLLPYNSYLYTSGDSGTTGTCTPGNGTRFGKPSSGNYPSAADQTTLMNLVA